MKMQIFFKYPDDAIGKAINWFGKLKTGNSSSCHVGWIIDGDAYESLVFGGVTKRNFKMAYKGKKVKIFDITDEAIGEEAKVRIVQFLEQLLGNYKGAYGFAKIPLQAVDAFLSFVIRKPVFFATRITASMFFICSGLIAYPIAKLADIPVRDIFADWRKFSPDDIADTLIKYVRYFIEHSIEII
jgi:hypothetical protein